ncbi:biopolymer transporter ExbD [Sphingosinicella sp. CPCC 101087]|uniref:ExbD/TolR family protein n=1 Tax=Sphingosinicella sp. CPCC 101087 TaxID=2497754 RepID=UPI001FB17994|nr:biopolymer transporter ExbD [Sphingosinicella sp. CPCC 101087]
MRRDLRIHPFSSAGPDPAPAMNTTPLIDLMLVLLVMFIVSVPIATHKVPLDAPPPGPGTDRPVHRLDIDAGGNLSWNGLAISDGQLAQRLGAMAADPTMPELHVAADAETRYARVDAILAEIARAGIDRMGLVGNERFARMMD